MKHASFSFFVGLITLKVLLFPHQVHAKVLINEVLPYPEDGVEAVELIFVPDNLNQTSIHVEGWSLWDELIQPSVLYIFQDETIEINQFSVKTFYNKLNNTGDSIIIKDQAGIVHDEFTYSSSQKGVSFARVNFLSNLFVLAPPSIGEANQFFSDPEPEPTVQLTPAATISVSSSSTTTSQLDLDTTNNVSQPPAITSAINNSNSSSAITQLLTTPELTAQLDEARRNVFRLKTTLDANASSQKLQLVSPVKAVSNPGHLRFQVPRLSKQRLLSVIIGGLLLIIVSRIKYD